MTTRTIPSIDPDIRLYGEMDDAMFEYFYGALREAGQKDGPIIISLTTLGGDPDVARRMGLEVRLLREKKNKELYFLGKTSIYSAGIALMSMFPKEYRFLTDDAMLLIHERRLEKEVRFNGPMRNNIETAQELLAEFQNAQYIEKRDFVALARGSSLSGDEVIRRAMGNWYVSAREAKETGLVEGII